MASGRSIRRQSDPDEGVVYRDAAVKFADSSIDWLYIDALHTRDALYGDLVAWWDKVRPGGLISGDDYGDTGNTSLMTSTRWEHAFGAVARRHKWGVISALERFGEASDTPHNVGTCLLQMASLVFRQTVLNAACRPKNYHDLATFFSV